jgi:hypothetical protein
MRRLVLVLLVLAVALAIGWIYEQAVVEKAFGPSAMLGASGLGGLILLLLATYVLSGTRHRDVVGKAWLALTSVVVSYLALDLAAGWVLIKPLSPPLVPDPVHHHRMVPNSHSEFHQRDFSYVQRVNNLGLRGADRPSAKPPHSYRMVMLGDSFTMGKGVGDDQTFSVVLERRLHEALASCGGPPIEVINAGVDSYAPLLSYLQLKHDLLPLDPDMVILNLDNSDLVQEAAYRRMAVRNYNGEIIAVPQKRRRESVSERVRRWTEQHLFFTRLVFYYANRLMGYRDLAAPDVLTQANFEVVAHTLAGDVDRTQQWRDLFESIGRIKALAEQHGGTFLLAVYPWAHQISDTAWTPGRYGFMPRDAKLSDKSLNTIDELSAQHGVQVVNLFPVFRAYGGNQPLYFDYDMHWTVAGHEVVARGFLDFLLARYRERWCRQAP